MQPSRARTSSLGVPLLPLARWVGWVAPVCPTHGVLVLSCPSAALRVCSVLGLPAPVHRCARSVCCVACAASWASRLLFTGVLLGVLCCVCGVLGPPAPVHRCARSVCCVACAVFWASRLLFTGAPARCVVWRVRRPGPPGSCSPVCPLGVLCGVCGVLGLPAPVHRCAARCVVLRVRRPGPPGSCSPVCPLGVLCGVCGVLGLPAPVHRCAARCVVLRVRRPGPPGSCSPVCCSVCCVACAASWASRLLFTGAPSRCVVLRVRRPGPPGSCSPVCPLGVLCGVCGVLGLPAPVHRCAARCVVLRVRRPGPPGSCSPVCCSVCCVACAVSWAPRLLFTGAPARCVVLRVRCPGPPGFCSPVRPLGVLCCVCGVLGLPAPVHRCARSVCCVAYAASWASRLRFTGVLLGVLCCVCGVLGLPAPVHRCARSVCCVACAASWASRLLFTGVLLGVLCCVCGVLGLPAPVHRCARSVCCVACAVSWASRLLFTGAPARCVLLRVRRPGPPGSCSPVCPLGVLCGVCGVLGLPAPVHRCAARCVVLRVRRPGPPGSCSPVRPLGVLCCVCGVLGLPAPVHRCARSVCCVAVRGVAAGRSLVHPDGGYRSRQGLGTLRAHTRPSGRRLFVAGRGWVPSGRALVHPDGGWRACARSLWPGRAGRPPGRVVVRLTFSFGRLVFLLCLAPSGLGVPPSLSLSLPFLAALALCFGCFSRPPAPGSSCASFVSPAWPLAALWWFLPPPFPFCVSRFSLLLLGALVFFVFFFFFPFFPCAPPLSLAFSGFRPRVPWASALCVVCSVGLPPLGSPCACPSFVLSASLVVALRWLLPPPPPPLFVSRFSWLPLGAVCRVLCCAVPPWVRCCAALLRVVSSGVVLSCAVLCSLGAAACCAVPSGAARCPGALCSAALCFAVFPRAVCVLSWRGGACCCSLLCFVLCVSRAAVLCVPCPLRSVRCCASLCWCARVVLFVWCVLLLASGAVVCRGAVLGPVARGFLLVACFGVVVHVLPRGLFPLWLVRFAVVPCFPMSCAVALCCRVVLCCRALLSFCGAVCVGCGLWAVVLCCVVLLVGCAVFCPVVVSACCGALFLVLCLPRLLRSVRCGALLPCAVPRGAVLPPGAVVSCPAALLGVFLAWVWLYLLEKPLQNFVKYFFPPFFFFFAFDKKKKKHLYTTQHTRVQQDHVRCCALRATRRS